LVVAQFGRHPDQKNFVILSEAKDLLFSGRNRTRDSLPFFKLSHPRLF
jgi:hypothetical protein